MAAGLDEDIQRLAALDDPVRRRVYLYVRSARRPVSREDVAAEAGISRSLAAFHLDKLVERGWLQAGYGRPSGRGGPGSGRPPKLYEPTDVAVEVSIPPRRYELLGGVLVRAVERGDDRMRHLAMRTARDEGRRLGQEHATRTGLRRPGARRLLEAARHVLGGLGFEPAAAHGAEVVLGNCPYRSLVEGAPNLVCAMNQAFSQGLLAGLGGGPVRADLDPAPGRCCVVLRRG
jgi:predicted ArsR family transcriptional regulator